tara:strand:- start:117 stop:347 length:231 start_codon:yes stop_codon:yes gene_type:complete
MEQIYKDLEKLVDYMYAEELRHWEEDGNPTDHIFHAINNIKNYLIGRGKGYGRRIDDEQKKQEGTSAGSNRKTEGI